MHFPIVSASLCQLIRRIEDSGNGCRHSTNTMRISQTEKLKVKPDKKILKIKKLTHK